MDVKVPISMGVSAQKRRELDFYNEYVLKRNIKFLRMGRNELCPCGSGKKLKHCHIHAQASARKLWNYNQSKQAHKNFRKFN